MVQRGAAHASIDSVRQHLLACAACDGGGGDGGTAARGRPLPDVAVMRLADGLPKLLTRPAFEALCDRLAAAAAAGERCDPADTPCLLQVTPPPAPCPLQLARRWPQLPATASSPPSAPCRRTSRPPWTSAL